MIKKRRLSASLLLLVIAFLLAASATYAWVALHFTANEDGYFESGEIAYGYEGAFIPSDEVFVPSENLLRQTIRVNNQSSIETNLRMKISYTRIYVDVSEQVITETVVYKDLSSDPIDPVNDDHININFATAVNRVGDYYLVNNAFSPNSGLQSLILSIAYDGDYVNNQYASQIIQLSIVIDVRQSDEVTWSELMTIDFETGYPA